MLVLSFSFVAMVLWFGGVAASTTTTRNKPDAQHLRGKGIKDDGRIDQELLAAFPDYYEKLDFNDGWDTVDENEANDDVAATDESDVGNDDHRMLQSCTPVTLDFNSAPDGMPLDGNEYVRKDWVSTLGVSIRAAGIDGGFTPSFAGRLLDSERPGPANNIGSPNNRCPFPGQGSGVGGRPSAAGQPPNPGENCDHLGNVLIIQDDADISVPKDYPGGGFLNFYFTEPTYVQSIGLLDIDTSAAYVRIFRTDDRRRTYRVPRLGDNSFQQILIERANVVKIHVFFKGDGAVTDLSFCPPVPPPVLPPPDVPAVCESEVVIYYNEFTPILSPSSAPPNQPGVFGWINGKSGFQPGFGDFLGRFANGDEYPWQLFMIPTYMDHVEIRFQFYEIDSWNSPDSLAIVINGEVVSFGEFDAQINDGSKAGLTPSGIEWTTNGFDGPRSIGFNSGRFFQDQLHMVFLKIPRALYGIDGKLYVQLQTIVTGQAATDESGGFDDFSVKAFFDCSSLTDSPTVSPVPSFVPSGMPSLSQSPSKSVTPSLIPSDSPSMTSFPSMIPSMIPSMPPSSAPSSPVPIVSFVISYLPGNTIFTIIPETVTDAFCNDPQPSPVGTPATIQIDCLELSPKPYSFEVTQALIPTMGGPSSLSLDPYDYATFVNGVQIPELSGSTLGASSRIFSFAVEDEITSSVYDISIVPPSTIPP